MKEGKKDRNKERYIK